MIYYQKGDVKKAIVNFEKTIEVYESIYGKHHISVGNRINNLGEAYRYNYLIFRSDKQYEKAL
jgi:tetratricopeptide (TPR) repeat protein